MCSDGTRALEATGGFCDIFCHSPRVAVLLIQNICTDGTRALEVTGGFCDIRGGQNHNTPDAHTFRPEAELVAGCTPDDAPFDILDNFVEATRETFFQKSFGLSSHFHKYLASLTMVRFFGVSSTMSTCFDNTFSI